MGAAAVIGVMSVATWIVALPFQIFSHRAWIGTILVQIFSHIASFSLGVARGCVWSVSVTCPYFWHTVFSEAKWKWGFLCLADGVLYTYALYTLNFRGLVLLELIEVCVLCVCVCTSMFISLSLSLSLSLYVSDYCSLSLARSLARARARARSLSMYIPFR